MTFASAVYTKRKNAGLLSRTHLNAKKGAKMKIPFKQVEAAINSQDNIGFCLACGEEQDGCEPDARKYECEVCGQNRVYGAEEILLMGAYS